MPRKINYPSYQHGGEYDDPTFLYDWQDREYSPRLRKALEGPDRLNIVQMYEYLRDHTDMGDKLDDWQIMDQAIGRSQGRTRGRLLGPGRFMEAIHPDHSPQRPVIENPFDVKTRGPSSYFHSLDTPAEFLGRLTKGGGKGLKGLLMAGAATAASPLAALADVLISPGQLGSGDLPEEDLLTDEQKIRYYQELMNQRGRSGLGPGPSVADIGREIDQWDLDNQYIPETMEGLGETRLSPRQQDILDMVVNRPRRGRTWDNRLGGGEERAREQAEARARMDTIRKLQRGRASGGIIGLRMGGSNRYDTDPAPQYGRRALKKNQPRYPNTAASQNPSYLQQQQQRGSNMAANTVRPANTGVERNSERKKREKQEQEQEQQQQQGPPAYQSQVTSYGVPQQTAQQWANLTDRITAEGQRPYQQYGGQRFAGFTQPEAAAMAGQVAYGQGQGPMGTRQAASTFGQAGQMIGGAQQGLMGLQPQYAQAGTGMRQTGARGEFQGQLAGAGMRTTGTEGQARQDVLGGAAEGAGTAGAETMRGIGTSMAGPEMQKGADLSQYMSQYTKGVTDPQLQQLMEFQRMQGQELGSQAAQAGAFGGLRQGVQATEQAKAASQQAADIIGQGQQQAFESAQQAFQADRAAQAAGLGQQLTAEQQAAAQEQQGLAAQRAAEQAGVAMSQTGQQQGFQAAHAGTQLGLEGQKAAMGALGAQGQLYNQAGAMGSQLAGVGQGQMQLGAQEQQQQFERLRHMEAAGEKQRALMDKSLGMGYQDWQNQMDQERRNIGWQGDAMRGLPYQGAVTQSRYQPQTRGPGASALATGVSALGVWNEFNRNQQGQGPQPQSANPAWGGGSNTWTDQDEFAYNPNANQGNQGQVGGPDDAGNYYQNNQQWTGGGPDDAGNVYNNQGNQEQVGGPDDAGNVYF